MISWRVEAGQWILDGLSNWERRGGNDCLVEESWWEVDDPVCYWVSKRFRYLIECCLFSSRWSSWAGDGERWYLGLLMVTTVLRWSFLCFCHLFCRFSGESSFLITFWSPDCIIFCKFFWLVGSNKYLVSKESACIFWNSLSIDLIVMFTCGWLHVEFSSDDSLLPSSRSIWLLVISSFSSCL